MSEESEYRYTRNRKIAGHRCPGTGFSDGGGGQAAHMGVF